MIGHKNRVNWIWKKEVFKWQTEARKSPLYSYVGNSVASPNIKGFLFCIGLSNLYVWNPSFFFLITKVRYKHKVHLLRPWVQLSKLASGAYHRSLIWLIPHVWSVLSSFESASYISSPPPALQSPYHLSFLAQGPMEASSLTLLISSAFAPSTSPLQVSRGLTLE